MKLSTTGPSPHSRRSRSPCISICSPSPSRFPQSLPDTLLYHLPRAALWKQQHAVAYVLDAPDDRINAFPPVAEIESMASMVLSDGDRYVGLVQVFASPARAARSSASRGVWA